MKPPQDSGLSLNGAVNINSCISMCNIDYNQLDVIIFGDVTHALFGHILISYLYIKLASMFAALYFMTMIINSAMMGIKSRIPLYSSWVKHTVNCTIHPLIKSEEHFDLTDNFLPASTCKCAGKQDTYPRRQPNNWLCRHGAIKKRGPERTVKAPITPA